jgi:hypothetical protein
VPARDTEGHHIKHWIDGGPTNLDNLASLCRFHHHRLHDGAFRIVTESDGGMRFETPEGRRLPVMVPRAVDADTGGATYLRGMAENNGHRIAAHTPRADDSGGSCDLDHTIWVLCLNTERAKSRAGPAP